MTRRRLKQVACWPGDEQAGNSPQMIFTHYLGLLRPNEAVAWCAIMPARPANTVELKPAA